MLAPELNKLRLECMDLQAGLELAELEIYKLKALLRECKEELGYTGRTSLTNKIEEALK